MLQAILIPRSFGFVKAMRWIISNGYKCSKMEKGDDKYYIFRQNKPVKGAYYYPQLLPNGVIIVRRYIDQDNN